MQAAVVSQLPSIVWFRYDLRVEDHPALFAAMSAGPVIPVFIWPEEEKKWPAGAASRWWLHYSLLNLQASLKELGLKLLVRKGDVLSVLKELIASTKAPSIHWNRRYEPEAMAFDARIKSALSSMGVRVNHYAGNLLFEPWLIANKQGKPFQVFTPFWKTCLSQMSIQEPLAIPSRSHAPAISLPSEPIEALNLLPSIHWDAGLEQTWEPGSLGAKKLLQKFLENPILTYKEGRDYPERPGVSRLSPHLHFGEISPRIIWHVVHHHMKGKEELAADFIRQLGWREFAHHLLYHFPFTSEQPLRSRFADFAWRKDPKGLKAWQKGLTGYPLVDAGMRQLWQTGWMHNRVRMVVGSFLVKHLRIHWMEGAKWFWDTLVDADLANNTLGWQWVAGCGADAAPYFRIFHPVKQGETFDPQGAYVRRFVPELARLPDKWIHRPWEAPPLLLHQAGVVLGKTYPAPIVDHERARKEALEAFALLREEL